MGEVHRLPNSTLIEREAADWFARMNADDVSADDRVRFEIWLRAHSANARAYAELGATWNEMVKAGPVVRAVYFGQAMNNAASVGRSHETRRLAGALAAVLCVVMIGVAWHFYQQEETSRFQTAIGEQVAVTLPDGSSIDLNSNSQVEVDYSRRVRVIRLERGEAYFKVAHDANRPFWVHAGNRWVRAVGTAFNVYLRPAGVQVTVSEGTVNVVNATGSELPPAQSQGAHAVAAVTAGEQADSRGRADVIRTLNEAQLNRLLAWRKNSLYFQDEPLGEVVNELMRYTPLKIEIADESLRRLPVGGTFQTNPDGAEALLKMLEDGFGAKVRRAGADHVYIEGPVE